ncbi:MAG: lysophospholipid acyltransferase family protein [Bacillota bacterium]
MLYSTFKIFFSALFKIFHRYSITGRENIPESGPVLIVSNHVSNWDPLLIGAAVQRKVSFMAKEELFRIPVVNFFITAWGAFKVKRGRGDREAINRSLEVLAQGKVMGIFIEGRRNTKDPRKMLKPQHGAAMLAVKSGAPVVPAVLINSQKTLRSLRRVKIIFGNPLTFKDDPDMDKKDLYEKISLQIVDEIMKLKGA